MNKKILLFILPMFIIVAVGAIYLYINIAFPENRCKAAHLKSPEKYTDCVECHTKVTPKITQDWYESKHGINLVRCIVCHGDPLGKGALEFRKHPDTEDVCGRCHAPSILRMQAKYGVKDNCSLCHPYHQNTIHRDAYESPQTTTKTTF